MKFDLKSLIIGVLSLLFIISAGTSLFLVSRLNSLEERNQQLIQVIASTRSEKLGQKRDPYLTSQVKNTISKNSGKLLAGYQDYLERQSENNQENPRDGDITLDWQIDGNGKVISPAVVRSSFKDLAFQKALVMTVKSWSFPPPPLGMNKYVEHTFRFQDKESAGKK